MILTIKKTQYKYCLYYYSANDTNKSQFINQ